ncbi:hypothetical protein D9613_000319 [Agrocybe pediades]|uniref:Transcription factor IIA, alpha/beta subunit n=1 Tax=Agrocybe pediades TaxID=84607 RepID=A0A8H4R172_9AGAR|nr:hypothetical protein D9613_000319 [Agrocybe pediades]KAF9564751.1 transcription factor IIA, alpha/beta subunit [Agrocybe pediades]
MSNKIVPAIYRAVIDDVIASIKPEFEEYGVAEEVLAELQRKWENKVVASHVAEFENPPQPPVTSAAHPVNVAAPHHHAYPTHPMHMLPGHGHYAPPHNPYAPIPPVPAAAPAVKTEPVDNRYMLSSNSYALPPLSSSNITAGRQLPPMQTQNGAAQLPAVNYPPRNGQLQPGLSAPRTQASPATAAPVAVSTGPAQQRIPQVDGPSESSGDEDDSSPPPGAFAPRTSHPSLPQPPPPPGPTNPDAEAINSDLDDSDTENEEDDEEGGAGETDIVFCTYDKVARVKNKWKCVLKDGMIHVNGKDYLFAKCTGEFEW